MPKVSDILNLLNTVAPVTYAAEYDNVGHLVGDIEADVTRVLISLDITRDVVAEAKDKGAELIVAHHPIIFEKLCRVTRQDPTGAIIIDIIRNGTSAICMHTNLDFVSGGVNDIFAKKLGLSNITVLEPYGEDEVGAFGGGRVGEYPDGITINKLLSIVEDALGEGCLRFFNSGKPVRRVAVGGGSCGGYLERAFLFGCDTLVTADIKHDRYLKARELGINLIDSGHFSTENIVCPYLYNIIKNGFPDISAEISEANGKPYNYFFN